MFHQMQYTILSNCISLCLHYLNIADKRILPVRKRRARTRIRRNSRIGRPIKVAAKCEEGQNINMKLLVCLVLTLASLVSSESEYDRLVDSKLKGTNEPSVAEILNCYWGTWANYRPGDGKFEPSNIDPNLCTHISYTFFGIEESGEFKSLDTWLDMDDGLGKPVIVANLLNPSQQIAFSMCRFH